MSFRPPYDPGPRLENRLAVALILAGLTLAVIVIVRILLPWLVGAGLVGAGIWFWHRHQMQRRALHLQFYEHLAAHQGRISVLEFAMATQLTGSEARAFLDARAREFFANFEPTDSGDVLYTFHTPDYDTQATTVSHGPNSGPVAQPTAAEFHPVYPPLPQSSPQDSRLHLTALELAWRLGCSVSELTIQGETPDFEQWSRQRDPDSCSWRYNRQNRCYSPGSQD